MFKCDNFLNNCLFVGHCTNNKRCTVQRIKIKLMTKLMYNCTKERQEVRRLEQELQSDAFCQPFYAGWNFNSGNYLFTTDTKKIHVSKFYCPSL